VAFEIAEVIDKGVARRRSDQGYLQSRLRQACNALPKGRHDELNRRLGNAFVVVSCFPKEAGRHGAASYERARAS
jgi:hypothetical protein